MFLAWKEVVHNKLKYSLIIGVLILISYLLFLISGLSYGLMDINRESLDKWDPDAIVVTKESNQNIAQSIMAEDTLDNKFDTIAKLKSVAVTISKKDNKSNTMLFGINKDEFVKPNITKGRMFKKDFEVVANDSIKQKGFKMGDTLDIAGFEDDLKIVGFTDKSKYNSVPTLFTNNDTADIISSNRLKGKVSAFLVKDKDYKNVELNDKLQAVEKETFITKLPGYTEQKLTLDVMSYFLFVISAFIIGIFLYIITIQKTPVFGLLKAQGIGNGFLAKSLLIQTLILSVIAVLIALGLTVITANIIPEAVPIQFYWDKIGIYGITIILTALLGGLFSIRSIRKVDPLKTIG
ncbi:ABC transporter permease [Macrococcus animalis]|uniref:ABC transporter permease n=1 Tax=Macrococcus animalis TaxID=3395467 RepID=UPI0039BDDC0C